MKLKKRLDLKAVFTAIYFIAFAVYLVVGLSPVEAKHYEVSNSLSIPTIGLVSDVTTLNVEDHELKTPDTIVGSFSNAKNKTLLIGHSTTVFSRLEEVKLNAKISYGEKTYRVIRREKIPKSKVSMDEVLKDSEKDTIVIMTCAGKLLGGGDATHRFMITAVLDET